ncbi:MAG: HEAT repeat domain-containing protein, partial [bacterium]|nr:HEAT repeat domain-containing protein [bacterium]
VVEEIPSELVDMVAGQDAQSSTLAAILANQPVPVEQEEDIELKEIQPEVRKLAIRLLRNYPQTGADVVEVLIKLCQEEDQEIRREAFHSLGCTADDSALDTILHGLEEQDEGVRLAALDALGNFSGSERVREQLLKMFEDPDPTIRQRVVEQIHSLSKSDVSDYLCRALEDDDLGVCRAALKALSIESHNTETSLRIENLIFRFPNELGKAAAATLRRMQDFGCVSRLLEYLKDEEQARYHWVCIEALAEMYSNEQV